MRDPDIVATEAIGQKLAGALNTIFATTVYMLKDNDIRGMPGSLSFFAQSATEAKQLSQILENGGFGSGQLDVEKVFNIQTLRVREAAKKAKLRERFVCLPLAAFRQLDQAIGNLERIYPEISAEIFGKGKANQHIDFKALMAETPPQR